MTCRLYVMNLVMLQHSNRYFLYIYFISILRFCVDCTVHTYPSNRIQNYVLRNVTTNCLRSVTYCATYIVRRFRKFAKSVQQLRLMSVRPSAWSNPVPTGLSLKFDNLSFFRNLSRKLKFH